MRRSPEHNEQALLWKLPRSVLASVLVAVPLRIDFVVLCFPHDIVGFLVQALDSVWLRYAILQCIGLVLDVDVHILRPTIDLALVLMQYLALVRRRLALGLALAHPPQTSFSLK